MRSVCRAFALCVFVLVPTSLAQPIGVGEIGTVAGSGGSQPVSGPSFDALDALGGRSWGAAVDSQGRTFVGLFDGERIARLNADGTATVVVDGLSLPMVFDFSPSDDLLIADHGNDRVLLATKASDYQDVREVLGSTTLKQPGAARFGRNGKVYIADTGNHRILELEADLSNGRVVAGGVQGLSGDGGAAIGAGLNFPIDMDVDARGVLVIADSINNRLRVVNLNAQGNLTVAGVRVAAGQIETLAGSGPVGQPDVQSFSDSRAQGGFSGDGGMALRAEIDWPFAPRFDTAGRIWFADADNHRIRLIDDAGTITTVAGNAPLPQENGFRFVGSEGLDLGDGGAAADGELNRPMDLELIEANGSIALLIGDTDNNRVRRVNGLGNGLPTDTLSPTFAGVRSVTSAGLTELRVRWDAATDDQTASDAIRFRVFLSTQAAGFTFDQPTLRTAPGARSATLRGLNPGTTYFVVVRAEDEAGNVDASMIELSATTDAPAPAVAFSDVQAIFSSKCTACHRRNGPAPFSLEPAVSFGNLVGTPSFQVGSMPRITPGDTSRSYLLHKVEGTHSSVGGFGSRMPLGGAPLRAAEIQTLRDWIEAGAPQ